MEGINHILESQRDGFLGECILVDFAFVELSNSLKESA
jgi:hypothetical protein